MAGGVSDDGRRRGVGQGMGEKRGTNIVLLAQFLAQGCGHDDSSDGRWCFIVSFARLSPRGVEGCGMLIGCA